MAQITKNCKCAKWPKVTLSAKRSKVCHLYSISTNESKTSHSFAPRSLVFRMIEVVGFFLGYNYYINCVRHLDILLDEQLYWKFHMDSLCNNLAKIVSVFKLIKRLVPFPFKRQLYYAYYFSRVTWGHRHTRYFIKKLHTENSNNAGLNSENTTVVPPF